MPKGVRNIMPPKKKNKVAASRNNNANKIAGKNSPGNVISKVNKRKAEAIKEIEDESLRQKRPARGRKIAKSTISKGKTMSQANFIEDGMEVQMEVENPQSAERSQESSDDEDEEVMLNTSRNSTAMDVTNTDAVDYSNVEPDHDSGSEGEIFSPVCEATKFEEDAIPYESSDEDEPPQPSTSKGEETGVLEQAFTSMQEIITKKRFIDVETMKRLTSGMKKGNKLSSRPKDTAMLLVVAKKNAGGGD